MKMLLLVVMLATAIAYGLTVSIVISESESKEELTVTREWGFVDGVWVEECPIQPPFR